MNVPTVICVYIVFNLFFSYICFHSYYSVRSIYRNLPGYTIRLCFANLLSWKCVGPNHTVTYQWLNQCRDSLEDKPSAHSFP